MGAAIVKHVQAAISFHPSRKAASQRGGLYINWCQKLTIQDDTIWGASTVRRDAKVKRNDLRDWIPCPASCSVAERALCKVQRSCTNCQNCQLHCTVRSALKRETRKLFMSRGHAKTIDASSVMSCPSSPSCRSASSSRSAYHIGDSEHQQSIYTVISEPNAKSIWSGSNEIQSWSGACSSWRPLYVRR